MTTEQALFLREFLLQRVEEAHLVTLRVLSSIPEMQSDYRPTKRSRSAREMACHIINTELILMNGIVSGSFSRSACDLPDPQMDMRDMIAYYDDRFVESIEAVRRLTVKKLTTPLSFNRPSQGRKSSTRASSNSRASSTAVIASCWASSPRVISSFWVSDNAWSALIMKSTMAGRAICFRTVTTTRSSPCSAM